MADEARAQRQAALADKKRRLEELKARRSQRSVPTTPGGVDSGSKSSKAGASANLDEYIDGLLKTPATPTVAATANESSGAAAVASPTIGVGGDKTVGTDSKNEGIAADLKDNVSAEPSPAPPIVATKQVETFEFGTQTAEEDFPPPSDMDEDEMQPEQMMNTNGYDTAVHEQSYRTFGDVEEHKSEEARVLTAEEMEKEVTSAPFSVFLNTASKKVERVLGSSVLADLLVDYDGGSSGPKRVEKASDGSKFLASRQIYECAKWTATRDVTDMDWSPLHRELMLSSYHMPSSTSSLGQPVGNAAVSAVSPDDTASSSMAPRSGELQSDGLVLVWNLAMPARPEHIFTCGSPVTTARFHPTESPLVIGGCQSGQIVIWDVRAGRMPVQKSSLTTSANGGKGHTHPICAMEYVEGGSGLVTGASDGRVNFWSLGNLRDPEESVQVGDGVSCLAVAPESETLICGDEFGTIYAVQSSQSSLGGGGGQRSRRQVRKLDPGNEGHFGMITCVAAKTVKTTSRAGLSKGFLRGAAGLFLSAGVDWTVKLWSPAYTDKPLLSLVSHSYDYMSDVKWSPAHPSLCATASSNGTIGLWNLANSLEVPMTGLDGIVIEPDAGSGRGLNKLKWSSDGRRMIVASADRVHVLSLSEDVVRQKGDEDARMMNHLTSRGLMDRD